VKFIRNLVKSLPSLLTAVLFAIAVWIFAVTQADPTDTRTFPQSYAMDVIGLDPSLMAVNDITEQITLTLRAPTTILDRLQNESNLIDVTLDLSGLEAGVHTLTPQVNIDLSPVEVVRINPSSIFVKLESVVSQNFPINVHAIGSPAIGFELQTPVLSAETATVTGPQSLVEAINEVAVEVDVQDVSENILRTTDIKAYDVEGNVIQSVSVSPSTTQVNIPVNQRVGYSSAVVKIVTNGQIEAGYRLTNIFALPPTVTIFSSDPNLVDAIPGFVETTPINLNGANENMEIRVALNLPDGISVVGSQNVTVQIGIEPIESSLSFTDIPVQFQGLGTGLTAEVSPENVGVFLSGPLHVLEQLDPTTIVVVIDMTDRGPGTYQLAPEVMLENSDLTVDAILPNTLEVVITQ
jgi:YbbR domain-containing protein